MNLCRFSVAMLVSLNISGCMHGPTIPQIHAQCDLGRTFSDSLTCVQDTLRADIRYKYGGAAFAEEYLASARVVEEKLLSNEITEAEARRDLMAIYREMKNQEANVARAAAEINLLNAQTNSINSQADAIKKGQPSRSKEIRCDTSINGRNTVCRETQN